MNFSKAGLFSILAVALILTFLGLSGMARADDTIQPLLAQDLLVRFPPGGPIVGPPAVAFDGKRYLAVWAEYTDLTSYYADIYGQFLLPSGQPHGPTLFLARKPRNQDIPAVAFNGSNYLVAWRGVSGGVEGRLVTPNGVRLGSEIIIADYSNNLGNVYSRIGVASDGAKFLVVWDTVNLSNTIDVNGQIVKGDGGLLGGNFLISTPNLIETSPRVAYGAGKYLVTWTSSPSLNNSTQIDLDGNLIDSATMAQTGPFPICTAPDFQMDPNVCFGSTDFLVVWRDRRNPQKTIYIHGTRISPQGTLLDGPPDRGGIVIGRGNDSPAITFDGKDWLVAWVYFEPLGARVSTSGAVLDAPPVSLRADFRGYANVALASDGTNYLLMMKQAYAPYPLYVQVVGRVSTNNASVANAGSYQSAYMGGLVTLDDTGSNYPDGDSSRSTWRLSPPPGSNASLSGPGIARPDFTPDLPGDHKASEPIETEVPAGAGRVAESSTVFAEIVVYRENDREEPVIVIKTKKPGEKSGKNKEPVTAVR